MVMWELSGDMNATIARVVEYVRRVTAASFHLSLVTDDLPRQRAFYLDVLGCRAGRIGPDFQDIDFFGHQLTFHQRPVAEVLGTEDGEWTRTALIRDPQGAVFTASQFTPPS